MIQCTMSTWASPIIIVPKKELELPKDPKTPLPVSAKLRLVCNYRKLNRKLPADFWSYNKEGQRIEKNGINAPYPLPCIDKMLVSIRDCKFLTTLDCTGSFHRLRLSPDAAKKSAFIIHLDKFEWNSSIWFGATTIILFKSNEGHIKWFRRLCKKLHG